ncbi:DUF3068 domain-containing protein [Streptomyces sp. WAC 01529]|uniref:DUF3068 domain-containing protein n=1 Tax=Streptomyces sp. WAC 01529 TaxID=2203205 RepID=UPI000F70B5BE|nr:DUF3068 domain-containing protein [Streptomyces sp. WAC 01529]AZM52669.1 DUF3068 domain-containing protein [Streptomyces sp. WAC 01529]
MRRKAGLVLLAFAVFFTAMSPLTRWYAFPRLAKVPANQYQEAVLEADDPTLIDYGTMKAKKIDKVTIVQTLKGNVEASEKIEKADGDSSRDVVVWDALSYVQDADGKMVSKIPERYIFDAHSQEPVHAPGESVDGDPVKRQGIEFKWPFLTEKRDYEYFDAQARVTKPIHYKGERTFRGVKVYYFEQTIPWTKVPFPKTMPVKGITPKSLAGTGTTRWYTTVRKFWVEPTTGAPVYGEEIQRNELRGGTLLGERDKVTVFAGHVKMREDYIESTVDLVKSQRVLVLLLTSYLPWGFLALGMLLLALSLWLEARTRRANGSRPATSNDDDPEPEPEPKPARA